MFDRAKSVDLRRCTAESTAEMTEHVQRFLEHCRNDAISAGDQEYEIQEPTLVALEALPQGVLHNRCAIESIVLNAAQG